MKPIPTPAINVNLRMILSAFRSRRLPFPPNPGDSRLGPGITHATVRSSATAAGMPADGEGGFRVVANYKANTISSPVKPHSVGSWSGTVGRRP
jgi:hypothetical protein